MKSTNKYVCLNISFLLALFLIMSCKKQDKWLDVKNSKTDVVPETLVDFQALLDNTFYINTSTTAGLPGTDNAFLTDANYNASKENDRNLYVWKADIWSSGISIHWNDPFANIQYANVILDGLPKIESTSFGYNNVKGQALFLRAFSYYNLVQLFCKAYSSTANSDLGLPLRTSSDVNIISQRSSLSETYQQIINDAIQAVELLPEAQPYVQRPINSAAYALIAKIYLNMGEYSKSISYATKCLNIRPQLIDFNNASIVNPATTYRFPLYAKNNNEVLFFAESNQFSTVTPNTSSKGMVAPELYSLYEENDLRKTVFYALSGANTKFRGSYSGQFSNFTGLATNEVYLIRSECYARIGNVSAAMQDLNLLLRNRYKSGTFSDKSVTNSDDALLVILNERRKELPFTANIRWEDLKRLNKETRFQKTITRIVNGVTYTLSPNNKRYVLPIPTQEIILSGLIQNER